MPELHVYIHEYTCNVWTSDFILRVCLHMQRFYSRLLSEAQGDAAVALQGAMVSMINDRRFSVKQWAAFVCYGLPAAVLPAHPEAKPSQLKMELEDLLGDLNLTEKKHTRPMPDALQAALTWFSEQGYKSVDEMLEANAPFTDVDASKVGVKGSKFELTAAGQEFQLVEALALKPGMARILLKNLDLQRKGTQS